MLAPAGGTLQLRDHLRLLIPWIQALIHCPWNRPKCGPPIEMVHVECRTDYYSCTARLLYVKFVASFACFIFPILFYHTPRSCNTISITLLFHV